jgi:RNA polymerase sigma-70 factor (sigma-E family)
METVAGVESFEAAFDGLFVACGRLAYRLLGDRSRAEEIAAEAMTRAFVHWTRISGLDHRDAWVLRVATNLAIDQARRRSVDPPLPRAVDGAETAALRLTLLAALKELPRRQREVVVLRHLTGLSEQEVVAVTGLAPGTVRTHLRRGLHSLRRSLGEEFGRSSLAAY